MYVIKYKANKGIVVVVVLLSCSYSDQGILEERKETKIFIERFFSHQILSQTPSET